MQFKFSYTYLHLNRKISIRIDALDVLERFSYRLAIITQPASLLSPIRDRSCIYHNHERRYIKVASALKTAF